MGCPCGARACNSVLRGRRLLRSDLTLRCTGHEPATYQVASAILLRVRFASVSAEPLAGRERDVQTILGVILLMAIAAAAVVVTVLAVAAIRRDRARRPGSGSLGAAMLEVQSLFEPSKRHTARSVRADQPQEEPGSGDPPARPGEAQGPRG